jgi:hypothetical protein
LRYRHTELSLYLTLDLKMPYLIILYILLMSMYSCDSTIDQSDGNDQALRSDDMQANSNNDIPLSMSDMNLMQDDMNSMSTDMRLDLMDMGLNIMDMTLNQADMIFDQLDMNTNVIDMNASLLDMEPNQLDMNMNIMDMTIQSPDMHINQPSIDPWYRVFGGDGYDVLKVMTADSTNNIYVAGTFRSPIQIGNYSFVPSEIGTQYSDIYVASFDAQGAVRWAYTFGGENSDVPYGITVDANDNVYILGSHHNSFMIEDSIVEHYGSTDLFVVSYDKMGTLRWVKAWGSTFGENPRDLAVDELGNIFITGGFTGTIEADHLSGNSSPTIEFGALIDIFVLAINKDTLVADWLTTYSGYGYDMGSRIAVNDDGEVVVAISYQRNLEINFSQEFDTGASPNILDSGGDNFNIGLLKLDAMGRTMWAREYGNMGAEEFMGLDFDTQGNIYVSGIFTESSEVGGDVLIGEGGHDVLLASYTPIGAHRWSVAYSGQSFDQPQDLQVTANGVYITGRFKEDLQFGDQVLNSQSICVAQTSDCNPECNEGFRCFNNTCVPETAVCEPACEPQFDCMQNNYDIFVGKFSLVDGSTIWSTSFGGVSEDHATSLAAGAHGGVFVGGHVTGEVRFEDMNYSAVGMEIDGFVCHLND